MAAQRPPAEDPERPRAGRARGELTDREPSAPQENGTLGALVEATGRAAMPIARRIGRTLRLDRATERVLETDTAKRVWEKVLQSEEAQRLVERVAEAPEVRSAITSQGVGLLEDLRRKVRDVARRLDTGAEQVARGALRREPRPARPIYAGAVTRLLALAIDVAVVYGGLLLVSAAIALLLSSLTSGDESASRIVLALGAFAWSLIGATYLVIFWSGAQRTPGMSFLGLRIVDEHDVDVTVGQAVRRAVWMPISALPLLLGFWGVLFEDRRRGWPDRHAHTVVLYADPELDRDLLPRRG